MSMGPSLLPWVDFCDNATKELGVQVSLLYTGFVLFGHIPRSGIDGSHGRSLFIF